MTELSIDALVFVIGVPCTNILSSFPNKPYVEYAEEAILEDSTISTILFEFLAKL